ncbi:hypothetical protein TIFTF001_013889 [Ficus carica]|uniref:Uncharacterized protein n=1 Tax=Ficus carica TaxID=3494 RepID=A0AA88DIC5_FICCA|nr:hypothetical protein TIFTF001_013889 [Ficus carica]
MGEAVVEPLPMTLSGPGGAGLAGGLGGPTGRGGTGLGCRGAGVGRREREGKRERKGGSPAAGVGAGGRSPRLGWSGPSGLGGPGWGRERGEERREARERGTGGRKKCRRWVVGVGVGRWRRSSAVNRTPAAEKTWGGKVYMR